MLCDIVKFDIARAIVDTLICALTRNESTRQVLRLNWGKLEYLKIHTDGTRSMVPTAQVAL
jgi:hypothetical protein